MNKPAGLQWIEAWLNGTICDEDFASLQQLLREDPAARQTLRRVMALDTALRDRAEAQALIAASQVHDDEANDTPTLRTQERVPRPRFAWREAAAWSAAAACLLLSTALWFSMPQANQNIPPIGKAEPSTELGPNKERQTTAAVTTIADQREQLLTSAPDVLHLRLVNSESGAVAQAPSGDIVWSSGLQKGYLRLQGLRNNELTQRQFQLWIIEGDAANNDFINGGMFFLNHITGELIVPIHADHFVQMPKMFLVSVEPLGEADALTTALLAKAAYSSP